MCKCTECEKELDDSWTVIRAPRNRKYEDLKYGRYEDSYVCPKCWDFILSDEWTGWKVEINEDDTYCPCWIEEKQR